MVWVMSGPPPVPMHPGMPPPEPPDQNGTRPATNWPLVVWMVRTIQTRLAERRAEAAAGAGQSARQEQSEAGEKEDRGK